MQATTTQSAKKELQFPPFSLTKLLQTTFRPKPGERICILIDLENPRDVVDFAFLQNPDLSIQRNGYEFFYKALHAGVMDELQLKGGEFFAYQITGGSNLDLPDLCDFLRWPRAQPAKRTSITNYDIVLCISTFSATAPLTAFAKSIGFRGATLHGLNQIILNSGLAVDYREVSKAAEKLRLGMTKADWVEIDFVVDGKDTYTLRLELGQQEAQKSHGICDDGPDVANLPAGEIYFVPTSANGEFPMKYEDGTLGLMRVADGRIVKAELIRGEQTTVDAHNAKMISDPVTGEIGELGFGTQELPVSGRDIQDEKILGTIHVATGRSDHLGGALTPDKFHDAKNATHDDILFAPHKTPEVNVAQARMRRNGQLLILLENFEPKHLRDLLDA
ncbi:MAG: hypothetical protein QM796_13330 [Chthoniobacteraceae bacterium]